MIEKFTIKHAPRQLNDVVFPNDDMAFDYEALVRGDWINNILLYGPPGTGKTTIAQLAPKTISPGAGALSITTINASLRNSKNAIEHQIDPIARLAPQGSEYNFIIFEEADGMSLPAQRALKQLMDETKQQAIYIFTTNHIGKIDPAICSRCNCFDMTMTAARRWLPKARAILQSEGVTIPDELIQPNIASANGDARKILDNLQRIVLRARAKDTALHSSNPDVYKERNLQ